MIIKGGAVGNTGWWSGHLQRDDTNDRAEVMEISGLLSTNLPSALREMEAIAAQSRSGGNFMYQANINPRDDERLTPEQWKQAVDTLEKELGLEGHQRVVVEHEKEGRVHRHVIWNRVDVDNLRVVDIGGNYYTHERVARELEQKFGLDRTKSLHGEQRPEGRPERAEELWQQRASAKTGIDGKDIRAELTDLWRKTDSGKAFAAAIEERGYILAQGDRRNFVVVDHAGTAHSLARRIEGAKAKDINERLADIDRDKLPTVDEARATQREKYPTKEQAREAWKDRAGDAAQPEQDKAQERHAGKPQQGERWQDRDQTKMEQKINGIQAAAEGKGSSVAAGLYEEGITLARVDAKGRADMDVEYRRQFENAKLAGNLDARLRRTAFKEGELVAVTKWGDVHRLNPRFIDSEKLERAVTGGSDKTPTLSAAREHFATARQRRKDERARAWDARQQNKAKERAYNRTVNAFKAAPGQAVSKAIDAGLKVVTAGGVTSSLGSFVESLLGMRAKPEPMTAQQQQQRALEALDDIRESIERGEDLKAADVANLLPIQLENLKRHGDAFLREMIADIERDRQREQDYSRTRER